MILLVLLVVMLAADVALVVFMVAAACNASPAVMTPPEVVRSVVEALELPKQGLLIEPGCGNGRVLGAAAKRQPRLRVLGVDNNPVLVAMARWRLRGRGQVRLGDVMKLDFGGADRVFLYLGPALLDALEPKLERELRAGVRVVSMHYSLPNRKPVRKVEITGGPAHARKLYIYEY